MEILRKCEHVIKNRIKSCVTITIALRFTLTTSSKLHDKIRTTETHQDLLASVLRTCQHRTWCTVIGLARLALMRLMLRSFGLPMT